MTARTLADLEDLRSRLSLDAAEARIRLRNARERLATAEAVLHETVVALDATIHAISQRREHGT